MTSPVRKRTDDDAPPPETPTAVRRDPPRERAPKIRCPLCAWKPRPSSRWWCTCSHAWNTFDTAGRCPSCGLQWQDTACPACHKWSKHRAWYAPPEET